MFSTVLTRASNLSLPWIRQIQSTPSYPISLSSILILSPNLRLDLPSRFFPSGFPTKILYVFLFFLTSTTCPAHLILIDLISRIFYEEHISGSSSLCNFLQSPVTPSLLGVNVFHSTRSVSHNSLKFDTGSFNRKLHDNAQFCKH